MSIAFNPHHGLIEVPVVLEGPRKPVALIAALDTGATDTTLSAAVLLAAGYDPAQAPTRVQVTTGSSVEYVPLLSVTRLTAFGQDRVDFPVLALTMPAGLGIDGVLGLDFFRGHVLTIDFRAGQISLS